MQPAQVQLVQPDCIPWALQVEKQLPKQRALERCLLNVQTRCFQPAVGNASQWPSFPTVVPPDSSNLYAPNVVYLHAGRS